MVIEMERKTKKSVLSFLPVTKTTTATMKRKKRRKRKLNNNEVDAG